MKIEKLEVSQHLDTRKLCRLLLSGEDEGQYNLYCPGR